MKLLLLRSANKFIRDFPSLKERIDKALTDIRDDPFIDGETKFVFTIAPGVASLYEKDGLWVLYRLNEDCTQVDIYNIGHTGSKVEVNHR